MQEAVAQAPADTDGTPACMPNSHGKPEHDSYPAAGACWAHSDPERAERGGRICQPPPPARVLF